MPNLRIIYDNVADSATVSASSTVGNLTAANLLTDVKSQVHRSAGTSVAYTLTWFSPQAVDAVALPATNLTSSARVQVRAYADEEGLELLYDTGEQAACSSATLGLHGWQYTNANAFAFGGASKTALWFGYEVRGVRRLDILLSDPSNPAGYIDCSRVVAGPYWEAEKNPKYGASLGSQDSTRRARSDGGDLLISRGTSHQTLTIEFDGISEGARAQLAKILRSAGSHTPMLYSLVPDSLDNELEQDHTIYGVKGSSAFVFEHYASFSTRIDIESW